MKLFNLEAYRQPLTSLWEKHYEVKSYKLGPLWVKLSPKAKLYHASFLSLVTMISHQIHYPTSSDQTIKELAKLKLGNYKIGLWKKIYKPVI